MRTARGPARREQEPKTQHSRRPPAFLALCTRLSTDALQGTHACGPLSQRVASPASDRVQGRRTARRPALLVAPAPARAACQMPLLPPGLRSTTGGAGTYVAQRLHASAAACASCALGGSDLEPTPRHRAAEARTPRREIALGTNLGLVNGLAFGIHQASIVYASVRMESGHAVALFQADLRSTQAGTGTDHYQTHARKSKFASLAHDLASLAGTRHRQEHFVCVPRRRALLSAA